MYLGLLMHLMCIGFLITPTVYAMDFEDDEQQEAVQNSYEEDEGLDLQEQADQSDAPADKPAESTPPVSTGLVAAATTSIAPIAQASAEAPVSQPAEASPATSEKKDDAPAVQAPATDATSKTEAPKAEEKPAEQQPEQKTDAASATPAAPEQAPAQDAATKNKETEEKKDAPAEHTEQVAPSAEQKTDVAQPASAPSLPTLAVPTLPEPPTPATSLTPEQQEKALAEAQEGEISSIDTVDVSSPEGNWLFKRIWWQKSNELYGKIRSTVDQIADARMHFYTEHVRIDRDFLDPFYTAVGFDQGQLFEIAATLTEQLDKKRKAKGTLDEQELEYYATVAGSKETIEPFNAAVESISKLADNLRDALVKLVEQLNRARSYESEAWRLLNAIAEELSDKVAREHYYGVLTQWQNVKEIYAYILGPYSQHFGQLVEALQAQTKTIRDALTELKDKGIKLGQEVGEHLDKDVEPTDCPPMPMPTPKKSWWSWFTGLFGW